jgi:hypothetical protein
MEGQIWVEPVGGIIIARLRGLPTVELLTECQGLVLELIQQTGKPLVLYDGLEMTAPQTNVAWSQRTLDKTMSIRPKRAIVVPNTKIAYLARLAFADEYGDNRVFYNDMADAFEWLKSPGV